MAAATDDGLTFAVLKGRSNYVCRQRVSEIGGRGRPADPGGRVGRPARRRRQPHPRGRRPTRRTRPAWPTRCGGLVRWAGRHDDRRPGRAALRAPLPGVGHGLDHGPRVPGGLPLPVGRDCFAEDARARAAEADVVVVNTHLYGAHLASGGAVLPEHQVVVFDEAHEVEDVMTDSLGLEVGPGPLPGPGHRGPARARRRRRGRPRRRGRGRAWPTCSTGCSDRGRGGACPRGPGRGHRHRRARDRPGRDARRGPGESRPGSTSGSPRCRGPAARGPPPRRPRGPTAARPPGAAATPTSPRCWPWPPGGWAGWSTTCAGPSGRRRRRPRRAVPPGPGAAGRRPPGRRPGPAGPLGDGEVAWVEDGARAPALRVSPIDVGPVLAEQLWGTVTAVLTSATVPIGLAERLGMPPTPPTPRRGQPLRLPRPLAALRGAPARPPRSPRPSRPCTTSSRCSSTPPAAGPSPCSPAGGPSAAASRRSPSGSPSRSCPSPTCPSRPWSRPSGRRGGVPVRHPRASGRASTCPAGPSAWSPSTASRSPDPTTRCSRPGGSWPEPAAFSTVDLPRAGTLLAQGAGRLIRSSTTAAWWPCSTAAWPPPATAVRCSAGSPR